MKDLNTYINEGTRKFDDADEYLEFIVGQSKKDPDIWDDTCRWEARDGFEYWESAFGDIDDVRDFIDEYASNMRVAGWASEVSFEDAYNIIPQKLKTIMRKSKPKVPYKTRSNKFEIWQAKDSGFDVNVMKFMNYMNDHGRDYAQYWYMISIED